MPDRTRILIVEDEAITAMLLRQQMTAAGYDVAPPQATARAAVELARSRCFDVVLMDIHLPGGTDGIEAAKAIAALYDVSVIFMTGYADEETRARAALLAPVGYLVKPVSAEAVVQIIETPNI